MWEENHGECFGLSHTEIVFLKRNFSFFLDSFSSLGLALWCEINRFCHLAWKVFDLFEIVFHSLLTSYNHDHH